MTLRVGQSVYGWMGRDYRAGTVVTVTPAGKVDVSFGPEFVPIRFRADGRKEGAASYDHDRLDDMAFDERASLIAQCKRSQAAANAINAIAVERCRGEWGKESLSKELDRLQTLLDTARAAVEAI